MLRTPGSDSETPPAPMGSVAGLRNNGICHHTPVHRGLWAGIRGEALLSSVGLAPLVFPKSVPGELGLAPACVCLWLPVKGPPSSVAAE